MEERIALKHSGRTVHGVFRAPDGSGPFPAALLSHGYNGCMTDFDATAERLAARGVASLRYCFCGGGTRDASGFPSQAMTLLTERDDALAMLRLLSARPEVDAARTCLFGASMGGLVSLLAARERPEDVAGLFLLYPALCVPDDWLRRFPDEADIPETVDFWGLTLGRRFFTTLRALDVDALLADCAVPAAICHGDADAVVPLGYSERAAERMPQASLRVFPGEGHGFSPEAAKEVDELLADFVLAH